MRKYVLEDLGVPVNSTVSSFTSFLVFRSTGDSGRAGSVGEPADLLDAELKVSMLYGDRDFICNCLSPPPPLPQYALDQSTNPPPQGWAAKPYHSGSRTRAPHSSG